jgi:hypothetical protein
VTAFSRRQGGAEGVLRRIGVSQGSEVMNLSVWFPLMTGLSTH